MSIWSALFTDSCAVWRYTGMSDTGDALYSPGLDQPPQAFPARADYTRKEVLDKDGHRVVSEASLLTDTPLHPLDKILLDGRVWEVKASAPIKGIAGQIDHYEVAL